MSVLLLNASYEPLRVVSDRKAATLLWKNVAHGVTDDLARSFKTVSGCFDVPEVIRLKHYVNVPRRNARWTRRGVIKRDDYTCGYCGRPGRTIDHVVPVSHGGKSTWGNTICSCYECNQRKADRTPHEAGMKLMWEPKTPRVDYLVARGRIPKSWKVYLEV
jgi:5-methylcytosine-specific restriction endonuclease McrA